MFINLTNHPSVRWQSEQRETAEKYGEIADFPFPNIDPGLSADEVFAMAQETTEKIAAMRPECVLCQGEFTFSYAVIKLLRDRGIRVVAACSERSSAQVWQNGQIVKTVVFNFCGFREYRD